MGVDKSYGSGKPAKRVGIPKEYDVTTYLGREHHVNSTISNKVARQREKSFRAATVPAAKAAFLGVAAVGSAVSLAAGQPSVAMTIPAAISSYLLDQANKGQMKANYRKASVKRSLK